MKTVTVQDVLSAKPCKEYTPEIIKALFGKRKTLSPKQVAKLKIPQKDILWALTRSCFLDIKEKSVRFSVFCAEQCIKNFEEIHPDDRRPRMAIEVAKNWLEKPSKSAAYSAYSAAYSAAESVAYSAYSAAYSAAESAAYSAAARFTVQKDQINFLENLLTKEIK